MLFSRVFASLIYSKMRWYWSVCVCVCVCAARGRRSTQRLQAAALPISGCRFHHCCCYYAVGTQGKWDRRRCYLRLPHCWSSYDKGGGWTGRGAVVEALSLIHRNYYHSEHNSPPTGNLIPVCLCLQPTVVLDGSLFINDLPNPLLETVAAAHSFYIRTW